MKRLASEQKIITLTWDSETKKSAILSQAVRFVLYFLFFTQPIGIIILGMQTDHHWLVYFFGLGAYIPTCWYVLATLKKMPRQIEKRMFQNISKTLPPSLKTMTSEILGAFNIKQELLEYWINSRAFGVSPAVISYGRKYHVILPLGFVKLLGTDEIEARQILAHEFSHIRQKDTDLLILVKLFIRAAVFFILPMLLINFIFSVYINIGNNLDARRDVDSFRSSFMIGGVDFDRVLKAEEDLEMNNRETIRNVVLLLIIIPGSLFLLRGVKKMINRSERVADLGGVVVGSSAGMIQTLENYTTGMKKRRFLPINPSVKWRIDQLKKLRETLPGSDSTFNPVDVKIEMFSKGTKWPLVVFCFFSLIVFPFIFISTIYQLFRLPELSFGALFLLTCEVLCKFLLTLWGLLMGLRILKGTDLPYFRLWIFCLANLAFIIADSTIVILFFSEMNRFVIFYSLLKSQWLPIVFFLAGSIIYVLPEKLITPTRAMRDFSDYK